MPPVATHTGNDFYVNIITFTIQQQSNPLLGHALLAAGYIGPYDWGTAQGVAAGLRHESATTPSGTNPLTTGQQAKGSLTNPLGGLAAIGDFFNRLTQANTWIRVGEVAAGVLLLYIGLKAATSGTPAGNAVRSIPKTIAKPAKVALSASPPGRTVAAEREAGRIVRAKKHTVRVQRATARKQGF